MKLSHTQHKDLMALLGNLCDCSLDQQEETALEVILLESAEARAIYRRYLNLHATLKQYHVNKPFGREGRESLLPTSPILGFFGNGIQQGVDFLMKGTPFSIFVTIVFPLLCVIIPAIQVYRHQVQDPVKVATLSRTYDCRWQYTDHQLVDGESLYKNQRLHLQQGLARITFTNGTNVILEGPATLCLRSDQYIKLPQGKLTAKVPKQAIGFSVETLDAIIVDLGTEFGVAADSEGWSETEVFKGKVEAGPAWKNKHNTDTSTRKKAGFRLLKGGQAARLDRKNKTVKVMPSDLKNSRFVRNMPTSKTVEFQQGIAGYYGTKATFIRDCVRGKDVADGYRFAEENEPDNTNDNFGNDIRLLTADKTLKKDSFLPEQSRVLIAFDNIFGERSDQVPPNAEILSATLLLHVTDDWNAKGAGDHTLHEVLVPWQESIVTWANFGSGGQAEKQYDPLPVAEFAPKRGDQFYKIDVTNSLQRWSQGTKNNGWLIINHEQDRAHFESDDAEDTINRPRLVVKYKIPD